MGMSASQARLLSITARITNNEFNSQITTNAKLRLAEKSEEASEEYMDALDSQQLMFGVYNDNGEYTTQELTPALLYEYSPLKNQYALINNAGKILVSNEDAKNYEKSDTLSEFLNCYGLIEETTANDNYEKLLEEYNTQKAQYDIDKAQYDIEYTQWKEEYDEWLKTKDDHNLYEDFSNILGTSEDPKSCYKAGMSGDTCYIHVLAHLLDWNGGDTASTETYTASNGQTVNLENSDVTGAGMHYLTQTSGFAEISAQMNDTSILCDGDDDYVPEWQNNGVKDTDKYNLLQDIINSGGTPTELDILRSDYIYDPNTNTATEKKTLKQKAIDLLYMLKNNMMSTDIRESSLINFTDGDMRNISPEPTFDGVEPTKPTPPEKPQYTISINDKDKAQWYTNLWHYMNGSETANKVNTKTITYDNVEETINTVEDCDKSAKGGNYEVFEDTSLFKSSEWLQFALEHGMISMKQATYTDPATDSYKVSNLTGDGYSWNSIIYTSATDITSQDDDVAIAIAEAKYKKTITEIESKDKQYDQDLKDLDTEHTALQTEYDSIKEVISKNVDRSFKAFS